MVMVGKSLSRNNSLWNAGSGVGEMKEWEKDKSFVQI